MSFRFLTVVALLSLTSCAYFMDEHIQDITLVTPGANDAVCYVYVDGMKYRFHPPQTVNVSKSDEDLEIDCMAPGNRRKKITVPPGIEPSAYFNVMNGVLPGGSWDFASKAMFKYPDVIEVDFTEIPVTAERLPTHNNPDIKQPEEYFLEEFLPSSPRLNSDRYAEEPVLERRERSGAKNDSFVEQYGTEALAPSGGGKGDLMRVIDNAQSGGAADSNAPTPLYPGQ